MSTPGQQLLTTANRTLTPHKPTRTTLLTACGWLIITSLALVAIADDMTAPGVMSAIGAAGLLLGRQHHTAQQATHTALNALRTQLLHDIDQRIATVVCEASKHRGEILAALAQSHAEVLRLRSETVRRRETTEDAQATLRSAMIRGTDLASLLRDTQASTDRYEQGRHTDMAAVHDQLQRLADHVERVDAMVQAVPALARTTADELMTSYLAAVDQQIAKVREGFAGRDAVYAQRFEAVKADTCRAIAILEARHGDRFEAIEGRVANAEGAITHAFDSRMDAGPDRARIIPMNGRESRS